jgi:cytoskeletal protein CcmA (bactofilin family)
MKRISLFVPVLAILVAASTLAQDAGELVIIDEPTQSDQYLAGRDVEVHAQVTGDVVAAGGTVTISAPVTGDVIVAAETCRLKGAVGDDVRAAGRQVLVASTVADHLVAAGQKVTLEPESSIGTWAWIAGERVRIDGRVGGEVRVAARRVSLGGHVVGDARIIADEIEIRRTAVIDGDLLWSGENEPKIMAGAVVKGEVVEQPLAFETAPSAEQISVQIGIGGLIFIFLSAWFAAAALYLLFPKLAPSASGAAVAGTWVCLGLGLAVFAATPVLVLVLFVTAVGSLFGLILLFSYTTALLVGWLTGALIFAEGGLRLLGKAQAGRKIPRVLAVGAVLAVLMLFQFVPLIGALLSLLTLLLGLGTLTLLGYRDWSAVEATETEPVR